MAKFQDRFQELKLDLKKEGIFKNSAIVTVSKILSSITNFIFMIFAVNLMTKSENGLFQYYLGFFPVLLALAEFGLPSALVKYLSPVTEYPERSGSLLVTSLLLKLYAYLFLIVLGLAAVFLIQESYFIVFLLVTGSFLASFASFFESILVSFQDYLSLSLWNPIPNLIRLVLLIGLSYYNSLGYVEILTIYCISPIFGIWIFFFLSVSKNIEWTFDKQFINSDQRSLSAFNSWALLASIFAILSDRMEIFFLKYYHGADAVAEYGTTLQLFSGFVIILSVLNSLVYPKLARKVETPEFKLFLWKSIIIGGGMGLILLPGIFMGDFIIGLLFKGSYANSVPVFHILYPNFILQLVFAPFGIALYAMGLPRFLAILALIRLLFGLLFDNLLIPDFGTRGAAISLFLGQIVSWLILLGYFSAILKSKDAK